jgi:c-di-GMP-related signal transduction protein
LSRKMADALDNLSLPPSTADALLGRDNKERSVLNAVIAYENGEWDHASQAATSAGVDSAVLPTAYTTALRWAQDISRSGISAPHSA